MSALNAPIDEQIFIALQAYEQLKSDALAVTTESTNNASHTMRLSFNDIVNCVRMPTAVHSKDALKIINQVIDYRRKYRFVLKQMSMLHSPAQVAASSEEKLLERFEESFSVKVQAVEKNQVCVELVLNHNQAVTEEEGSPMQAYLHCECEEKIEVVELGAQASGQFFDVLKKDDPRLQTLTDINTQIYVTF